MCNYNHLNIYLASKLFRAPEVSLTHKSISGQIKYFCIDKVLPSSLVCCKKNRHQIAMDRALQELDKKIDVIEFIRRQRFMKLALEHLLD